MAAQAKRKPPRRKFEVVTTIASEWLERSDEFPTGVVQPGARFPEGHPILANHPAEFFALVGARGSR